MSRRDAKRDTREYWMQPGDVAHDDMIEALASDRIDDAFRAGVLLRRSRRGSNRLCRFRRMVVATSAKTRIAIVAQISRRLGLRKSIAQLY